MIDTDITWRSLWGHTPHVRPTAHSTNRTASRRTPEPKPANPGTIPTAVTSRPWQSGTQEPCRLQKVACRVPRCQIGPALTGSWAVLPECQFHRTKSSPDWDLSEARTAPVRPPSSTSWGGQVPGGGPLANGPSASELRPPASYAPCGRAAGGGRSQVSGIFFRAAQPGSFLGRCFRDCGAEACLSACGGDAQAPYRPD